MSDVEDKNMKNKEEGAINEETGQQNIETTMAGNASPIDSNKNNDVIGAISEKKAQVSTTDTLEVVDKESGETNEGLSSEKMIKYDEIESQLTERIKEALYTGLGRGGGDFAATSKVSDEAAQDSDKLPNLDEAIASNSSVIGDKDDKMQMRKAEYDADQIDEVDGDDIELRWDDDDGSDEKTEDVKNDKHTEHQLLQESSNTVNEETSENVEGIETIPNTDILTENNSKVDATAEKKEEEINDDIIEDKLLEEPNINTESSEISVDKDTATENIVDENNDSSPENILLQKPQKYIESPHGNTNENNMAETEIIEDKLEEDALLAELEDSPPKDTETVKDVLITENIDNIDSEDKLLEQTETIVETDVSMKEDLVKHYDISIENKVTDIQTNAETEVTSKADVSMDIAEEETNEKLLDIDESQNDSCTAMEVDNTMDSIDKSIVGETEKEKKNIDEPIQDVNITEKDEDIPINSQSKVSEINKDKTNVETVVKDKGTELVIEHDAIIPKLAIDSHSEREDKPTDSNILSIPIEDLENESTDVITLQKEIEDKIEPTKNNEDETVNKTVTDGITESTSLSLDDSLINIKTDHGLHKPDVMLEIPSQEFIDIDAELSMNLDQSGESEKNISNENIVQEKAVEQKATVTEDTVGQDRGEGKKVVEQNTEDENKVRDLIVKETIEESLERMFADDEPSVPKAVESIATTSQNPELPEAVPSTSSTTMMPDTSDEVPEMSDSLGLLAESTGRMMEDDEEQDDDDDGDDDDDFDQDESSNQISAEQSEDSNPTPLEAEPAREEEKDLETPDPKDDQFQFMVCEDAEDKEEEKMEIEEESYGTVELPAESINEDQDQETKSAEDSLMKDVAGDTTETVEDPQEADQMDIETVKLSDTSDNDVELGPTQVEEAATSEQSQKTEEQQVTPKQSPSKQSPSKKSPSNQSPVKQANQSPVKQSPSKMSKLEITPMKASKVVNFVDLEETSSSEDDIQEVQKQPDPETDVPEEKLPSPIQDDVTNVNIPKSIDIMCTSGGNTSEIVTKEGESVISGVPKPPPHKPARLNTSEVSIKTASNTEPLVIPEAKINEQTHTETQSKTNLSLEIFSLDSDEEDSAAKDKPVTSPHKMTSLELEKARETNKCINYCCTSGSKVPYKVADTATVAYYDAGRKRRSMVCQPCADVVANRTKNLIEGIKNLKPLLDLDMGKLSQDLVEISDSESEDEETSPEEPKESIGEKGAKFLEDNLAQLLNDTWRKYDMDTRLKETQIMLDDEIEKLEQDSKEIDAMLNECQVATDKLRCDLYAAFQGQKQELPPIILYDTPTYKYFGPEVDSTIPAPESLESRYAKRRLSSTSDTPAKRPAIPLGYAPLDAEANKETKITTPAIENKMDDDKDISVVKLSAEAAPADLPPPGEISRPPLRVSMPVYAMKNAFGPWLKGRLLEIQPKNASCSPFSLCRVKFDHKTKTNGKVLPARCIAYAEPADVRMTIGTRLIALFKDSNKRESYYSGVVAEIPNPVNNYRYLVFFDDGYAQYVSHAFTRLVCESSPLVWEEVHPFSRDFVKEYLLAYPERPMVRLHEGQHLKTEWNGKWWSSRVTRVDASLAQVMFVGDGRREWIYRGSTRLAPLYLELRAAERHRPRPMPRSKAQPRSNMPYVEYTRSDEPESAKQPEAQAQQQQQQQQQLQQQQQTEEIRRQRAVAKKSTSVSQAAPSPQQPVPGNLDTVTSRVVYYTPKNAVKPYKMTPHKCGPKCKRSDVLSLKELRTYNPLAKPLLSGWERQIVRFKGHKEVMYRAPCGRRVRSMRELHKYLLSTESELPVDLFDFHHGTHCLAEFVLNKCRVGKKDLSHGKENVPVPCVNYYDDSLPEFCSYNTERTPTAGVPLNLDPEFLCGCDCTDDCQDKTKCACWKMTLEGARTIGLDGPNLGYVYKRLPEPLPSGIYECNSRCKCKHTCLNRVAQHPLQLKLQVFKTLNRGWGIRALNDVPKGSFLCVYAGNLLTDATANLDGLNEGDEYLAELDYIEVVEQMKEGYEEDIPEADKKLDKKDRIKEEDDSDEEPSSSGEESASKTDKEDDDFSPGYIGLGVTEFNKRLRRREKAKKDKTGTEDQKDKEKDREKEKEKDKDTKDNAEEDCITISDDEEVREPSRFTVQAGMGANVFISKYKSVRTLFGKDEACYIMDAKVQGNIGRYLNHSCCPNVFVQNVFVDTHDPRFPWVAFFALSHIKAGTELTWNYNYDVGSVPGKVLYCYCGAPNCRGRLL